MNLPGITDSSSRTGESLRAFLIRKVFFSATGLKRTMRNVDRFVTTIPKQRQVGDAPPPKKVQKRFRVTAQLVAGSNVYVVDPHGSEPTHAIIYLHGGGYVGNMQPIQWSIVNGLATRTGARVYVPGYPLAPEHNWRDAYAMISSLYERITETTQASNVTLTGDSAGGGLALGFAQALRDDGRTLPGSIVLFSPWLDLRLDNPAQEALDSVDPMLARPLLEYGAKQWAAGTALDDPHISPLFGSLKGLPPVLMFSGTADMLNADAHALVQKAGEEGASVKYVEHKNMTHVWSVSPIPEAKALYDEAADFILNATPR